WPTAFHAHFYTQVWCTYRTEFEPIRDLPGLSSLPPLLTFPASATTPSFAASTPNATSDAGWGRMLRTGQSLLATALQRHTRLLSCFLHTPVAPFGVHRMALADKAASKDVGMWFGPSAAAAAMR
ncbi:hypothetical protein B0H17DRAFT_869442, partial [Mycena rosella]